MSWPVAMVVMGVIGFYFATRIWNARPKAATLKKGGSGGLKVKGAVSLS